MHPCCVVRALPAVAFGGKKGNVYIMLLNCCNAVSISDLHNEAHGHRTGSSLWIGVEEYTREKKRKQTKGGAGIIRVSAEASRASAKDINKSICEIGSQRMYVSGAYRWYIRFKNRN